MQHFDVKCHCNQCVYYDNSNSNNNNVCFFVKQLLQIAVGPSVDPAGVTMVDSVKVYTKLKESFNWPDDSDDSPDSTMTKAPASGSNVSSSETAAEGVANATVAAPAPLTSMDRYVMICHVYQPVDF